MKVVISIVILILLIGGSQEVVSQPLEERAEQLPAKQGEIPINVNNENAKVKIELTESGRVEENVINKQFIQNLDVLQENLLHRQQEKIMQEQRRIQEKKMSKWIVQEMDVLYEIDRIATHEKFSFVVIRERQFRWDHFGVFKGQIRFVVEVFDYSRGEIVFPENPGEQKYVQIQVQGKNGGFRNLGKVYLKKLFTINFGSDFHNIRLINRYGRGMIIQIGVESTDKVLGKVLDDDVLKVPAKKIGVILEEFEESQRIRQKSFRGEWGFKQRQEHHQSQMLILTGVELFVIIGTAIVQIYCIKNLFDSRLIL